MSSSPAAPDWLWVAEGSVWLVIAAVPFFFFSLLLWTVCRCGCDGGVEGWWCLSVR